MDSPFRRSRHPVLLGVFVAVIALGAAVLAAAAWAAFSDGDEQPQPDEVIEFDEDDADPLVGDDPTGDAVPDTVFPTLDGGTARLTDYRGEPVVVNFFGSWCVPCREEMPAFQAVHAELGDRVTFVGLAVNDSERDARAFVESAGVTYDVGRDASGALFESFGVVNMPSTFLVSAGGEVVASHAGALSAGALRDLIDEHLLS